MKVKCISNVKKGFFRDKKLDFITLNKEYATGPVVMDGIISTETWDRIDNVKLLIFCDDRKWRTLPLSIFEPVGY